MQLHVGRRYPADASVGVEELIDTKQQAAAEEDG